MIVEHFEGHQAAVRASMQEIATAAEAVGAAMVDVLRTGHKIISFGNGGSGTQASHFAGELIGRFKENRRPLPGLALVGDAGSVTCIANDFGYGALFERQVEALVRPGDMVVGLTTSGKSENVCRGLMAAQKLGAITVALTGVAGLVGATATHVIRVPSSVTAYIQEVHIMLIHAWCIEIDKAFA